MKRFVFLSMLVLSVSILLFNAACNKGRYDVELPPKGNDVHLEISDVKGLYQGKNMKLGNDIDSIFGVVISDAGAGNIPEGVVVIEQNGTGIAIALGKGEDAGTFVPGDSVAVDISGASLIKSAGNLTITGPSLSNIEKLGSGKTVKPKPVTLKVLYDHFERYSGTLIKVVNVDIVPAPSDGDTYSGTKAISDGTMEEPAIQLNVLSGSVLASEKVDETANYTGIARYGADKTNPDSLYRQIWPRNSADIVEITYTPVHTPIIITGFLVNPAGADAPEPHHKSWDWYHADTAGYEYIQLMALEDIDFSKTPYSMVVCNNGTVQAEGWAEGYRTSASFTYKFDLTHGFAAKGTFFYVGGKSRVIDGYDEPGLSTSISSANWIRTTNINDGSTGNNPPNTTGDGFGAATGGLMQNDNPNGNADGIAVFEGTNITASSIPLDAVFFNPPVGTALSGSNGYQIPNSDLYSRSDPSSGASQPLFGEGTNTFVVEDAGKSDHWTMMGGIITDKGWLTVRNPKTKVLNQSSKLSDIESGAGITLFK